MRRRWTRRGLTIAISPLLLAACGGTGVSSPRPTVSVARIPTRPDPPTPLPPTPTPAASGSGVSTTALPRPAAVAKPDPTATVAARATPAREPPRTATPDQTRTTGLLKHTRAGLAGGTSVALQPADGALVLARSGGGYAAQGTLTSPEISAPFAFDTLVPSWNADAPAGTRLQCALRVRGNREWSAWYDLGHWSATQRGSVARQHDALGTVEIDTLKLVEPARSFQYRLTLTTDDPHRTPALRLVAVNYADLRSPLRGPTPPPAAGGNRDLPVPVQSQLLQPANLAWDVCSPTSLAMVLQYWKIPASVPEVIDGVRDMTNGIFGNWPFNTAYAGERGLEAHVDRFVSLVELQNEIAAGRPAVASIRFRAGELDNAPIPSTSGHLLVVRGFTASGDVIVNDPVAPNLATVRRVYRRDQFAHAWLDHGGVVYQIRPR